MKHDPLRRHCQCGYSWKLNRLHYIRMLFKDITLTCPKCGFKHQYHMTYFVNERFNETKRDNKQIESNKRVLWSKP